MRHLKKILLMCLILTLMNIGTCSAAEPLHIAFNYNTPPYQFIGEDNTYIGLHIDLMNWIAKNAGYEVVYMPYKTNMECIQALKERKVDVVLGHRIGDRLTDGLMYTDELSVSSLCLVTKTADTAGVQNSNQRQLHAVTEFGMTRTIYMDKMNISSFVALGNQRDVFEALQQDDTNLALMVYDSFQYQAQKSHSVKDYEILRSYISPLSYAMLLRKDEAELCKQLNRSLAALRAGGEYQKIYKRWISESTGGIGYKTLRKINYSIAIGLAVALIAVALVFFMNRYLKSKVNEKTAELRFANAELDKKMNQLENENNIRDGMIENSPSAMVSFDQHYRVLLMNSVAIAMANAYQEHVGTDVRKLPVLGDIVNRIEYDPFSSDDNRRDVSEPKRIEIDRNGGERSYRYNLYRLLNENAVSSVLLTVEDVTLETERARESFEKDKLSAMNQLIAGIAHEIRNPLMAIRTSASLLEHQWDDPEVRDAFVRFVPNEVHRINQLIENLIGYARPVKGTDEALNLAEVVRESLYLTTIAAKKNHIECVTDLDDHIWIIANHDKVKQSIINIIINGIESIEKRLSVEEIEKPTITIRVKNLDGYACVSVRDVGVGMSPEDIRRCTQPFYSTKSAGTGLGMALVQQYMDTKGGKLWIESELNRYTEVQLRFRREQNHEAEHTDH